MPTEPMDTEGHKPLKPILFDILVILAQGDRHGWSIVKALEGGPGGWKKVLPGNLYRTLRDMTELGLIAESHTRPDPEDDDERRRYFRITGRGRAAAGAEALRLRRRLTAAYEADLLPADGHPGLPGVEGS
jgi:DNA-binding PadR family transcriptional regulator